MTREQAIKDLREQCHTGDTEGDHLWADEILCKLLESLGYGDVVAEWNDVIKWYA
jgi:hypothetical protein